MTNSKNTPTTTVENITPEKAAALLESNTHNRPLSMTRVKQYADSMRNGVWMWGNGVPIVIDTDETLVDGQHRLSAIVLSGATAEGVHVVWGADPESFDTFDCGKARTLADALFVADEDGLSKSRVDVITAVAKMLLRDRGGDLLGGDIGASIPELRTAVDANGWGLTALNAVYVGASPEISMLKNNEGIPESTSLFMYYIARTCRGAKRAKMKKLHEWVDYMADMGAAEAPFDAANAIAVSLRRSMAHIKEQPFMTAKNAALKATVLAHFKLAYDVAVGKETDFSNKGTATTRLKALTEFSARGDYLISFNGHIRTRGEGRVK